MNASLLAWLATALVLGGALFCVVGAIGVLRLPDCYSRMHSASKAGALGAAMVLAGVAAATGGEAALEAMLALVVLLASAPLAAHAVSRAAHRVGVKPLTGELGDALAAREAELGIAGEGMTQERTTRAGGMPPAAGSEGEGSEGEGSEGEGSEGEGSEGEGSDRAGRGVGQP